MIPHRVRLSGFLSYKGEQDIRFDGAPVWMLAGTNGSGKSSIFDAVTYALFGHHRGGSQNAGELINKESNGLTVDFDFHLDGQLYRIKRTLRRTPKGGQATTQQVYHFAADDWQAIPDTTRKVNFDAWVSQNIGLSYEIFTSSVLLLQGKAEKLLDSKPSGRFEVLAGIVDLERYQRLHDLANTKKNALKGQLETLNAQAEGVPDVTDEQYAEALIAILTAEAARDDALAAFETAQQTEIDARRWSEAEGRASQARAKLADAEKVLTEAVRIEKEHARLTELKAVLPTVQTVVTVRTELNLSADRKKGYEKRQAEEQDRKQKAEHLRDKLARTRTKEQEQYKQDEESLGVMNTRLRELTGLLQTVRLADDERAKVERLKDDAKALPADPEGDLSKARDDEGRLQDLSRVLPILEMVSTDRHNLGQAFKQEADSRKLRDDTKKAGLEAKSAGETFKAELDKARTARTAADTSVGVANAELQRATAAVAEFATLNGAKSCRACGQPLTPAHFKEEKAKREDELKQADAKVRAATAAAKAALEAERALTAKDGEQQKQVEALRDQYKEHEATFKQSAADIKRLTEALSLRYAELPPDYRKKIAPAQPTDWPATRFPERDELVKLRREVESLDGVRRAVRAAEAVLKKWNDLKSRTEAAEQNLSRLTKQLPDSPEKVRSEHAGLQTQETTTANHLKEARLRMETLDRDIDKAGREAHQAVTALADYASRLRSEEEKAKIYRDNLDQNLKQLPPDWRAKAETAGMTERMVWDAELQDLEGKGTAAKFRQLEQARAGLGALRDDIARLEAEANEFPPAVRIPNDTAKAATVEAKQTREAKDKELREAEKRKDTLDGHRARRADLSDTIKGIDLQHTRHKTLSELLGKERLQRHLVRQAERQIVDYGNAVLDRLSGGQLFLKLVGTDEGEGNKALDLECYNRHTGGAPINVAFLSGSQKFRVAVSLALAIGQYASRQHRPIESVIIDEGFGCLDRQGRQVMIQELQNLRGHLHCILLVSHQEEFADAFADGYRFELQDGATKVSRFQR